MPDIYNLIDPNVMILLTKTGAKFEMYSTLIKHGYTDKIFSTTSGFYHPQWDLIAINDYACIPERVNEVILHELIHWSGAYHRLARPSLINIQRYGRNGLQAEFQWSRIIEEVTAQQGMYVLAKHLGLDMKLHLRLLNQYIATYPAVNRSLYLDEVDKAVEYLLGFTEMKLAA